MKRSAELLSKQLGNILMHHLLTHVCDGSALQVNFCSIAQDAFQKRILKWIFLTFDLFHTYIYDPRSTIESIKRIFFQSELPAMHQSNLSSELPSDLLQSANSHPLFYTHSSCIADIQNSIWQVWLCLGGMDPHFSSTFASSFAAAAPHLLWSCSRVERIKSERDAIWVDELPNSMPITHFKLTQKLVGTVNCLVKELSFFSFLLEPWRWTDPAYQGQIFIHFSWSLFVGVKPE